MAINLSLTGEKLATLRRRHFDMSQARFAQALGIAVRTYIRFEVGKRKIPGPVARLVFMLNRYGIPKELMQD